jgi:signal transduction histidine kinase
MHSLRSRLIALWVISLVACVAVSLLLVQLYRQSTAAQVGRAEAVVAHACDLIRDRYQFYTAGWQGPVPALDDDILHRDLTAAVALALARQDGVEGGIWQSEAGSLAYAYPTYEGSGPKTDLPAAERDTIRAINDQSASEQQRADQRVALRSQTLLLHACPLNGPIPRLTAWTMTRVQAATGSTPLGLGLAILLALMLGMSALLTRLTLVWSRRVKGIESVLAKEGGGSLPTLERTGERELDRIIDALNEAATRLVAARQQSEALAAQVASSERLAALGRVAAGIAHEIRNPIAAMRLRAENALAGDDARRQKALADMLEQIDRLNTLVSELLAMTQRRKPHAVRVEVRSFLTNRIEGHRAQSNAREVTITVESDVPTAMIDEEMVGRIVDNLLSNAIRHTPSHGRVSVSARGMNGGLRLTVADSGAGVASELRDSLFEPFVTGRADGTGLGLAIARELADAHGGDLTLLDPEGAALSRGAVFVLDLPGVLDGECPDRR